MKPMLAGKFPGNDKLKFPLLVQPKLDGIRAMVVGGKLLTRTLKAVPNAEIRAALERPEFEGLDGELLVGEPTAADAYRRTVSFVMAEDKTGEPWCFHVFDLWLSSATFEQRHALLAITKPHPRIALVPSVRVRDLAALAIEEARLVEAGYEGAILRGPSTLYKFGRGSATAGDLLKLKRFTDSEAVVVGVFEEMHNANERFENELGRGARSSHQAGLVGKGRLGGLIVRLLADWEGFPAGTEFRIGTGFTAQMRADLWAERYALPGRIAKFKAFPVGAKDRPRHPVFLYWRDRLDLDNAPEAV